MQMSSSSPFRGNSLATWFVLLVIHLSQVPASAWEIISTKTNEHNFFDLTHISVEIEFLSAIPINFLQVPVTGALLVDFDLDGTNSGTIRADVAPVGDLQLANTSQSFAGTGGAGTAHLVNVGGTFSFGTEAVTNRNFAIDASTPGGLILNQGLIRFEFYYFVGIFDDFTFEFDLSVDPISFLFSDLGSATIAGTTDLDQFGLDPEGEVNFSAFSTSTTTNWLNVTNDISLSGGLFFGEIPQPCIPEVSTLTLSALASLSVLGWVVLIQIPSANPKSPIKTAGL